MLTWFLLALNAQSGLEAFQIRADNSKHYYGHRQGSVPISKSWSPLGDCGRALISGTLWMRPDILGSQHTRPPRMIVNTNLRFVRLPWLAWNQGSVNFSGSSTWFPEIWGWVWVCVLRRKHSYSGIEVIRTSSAEIIWDAQCFGSVSRSSQSEWPSRDMRNPFATTLRR